MLSCVFNIWFAIFNLCDLLYLVWEICPWYLFLIYPHLAYLHFITKASYFKFCLAFGMMCTWSLAFVYDIPSCVTVKHNNRSVSSCSFWVFSSCYCWLSLKSCQLYLI